MVTEEAAKECLVCSPLEEDPGCSTAPKEAGFCAVLCICQKGGLDVLSHGDLVAKP